ncbi:MAG TPA: 3-dehydroquinate synthase [Candidatus Binataceae bacterium]|nr:3-dehydroquinate synthase [Candidatus Binataceae bacterium]
MPSFDVQLGARSHPVHVAAGLLARLGQLAAGVGLAGRCVIVTDYTVGALYLKTVEAALKGAGFDPAVIRIAPGEASKSSAGLGRIYDGLIEAGLDRSHAVFALGGGVVGDLAGFAAATYLRGVPLVQVPTTLLAQVDSALGGKTAIDHPRGKNLIGAFYQPRLIVADVETLRSLGEREFREGLAEVIKYGAIMDAPLIDHLEHSLQNILGREPRALEIIVERSLRHKAFVVERDEQESDLRTILNFGHTVGHALEMSAGYGHYLHGEAVAIGMTAASRLSCLHAGLAPAEARRLQKLIETAGLPVELPAGWLNEDFARALRLDKKRAAGTIRFVLLDRLGHALVRALEFDQVTAALAS